MVVISVKHGDGDGFLFETTTDTNNDDLIRSLVNIHNGRLRSAVIIDAVRGLAQYGPMKDPNAINEIIDTTSIDDGNMKNNSDPTGSRTGVPPDEKAVETLTRVAQDLEVYIDKAQVQKRVALKETCLKDKISNVRGAIMIAYPMGLPEWDVLKTALDSDVDGLKGTAVANQVLDAETTSLWVAGKEFQRGKLISDRLGKNEKTKVIAKLAKRGSGPPGREAIVNEEERKAMMAHYFKRQEELKKLAEGDEDDYLNSEWADTKSMKNNLQGLGNIKAPGMRF